MVVAEMRQNLLAVMGDVLVRITFATSTMTAEITLMKPDPVEQPIAQAHHLLNVKMATVFVLNGNVMAKMTAEMVQMKQIAVRMILVCFDKKSLKAFVNLFSAQVFKHHNK